MTPNTADERQSLLQRRTASPDPDREHNRVKKSQWAGIPFQITSVPRPKLLVGMGMLMVFFNESMYYLKQGALVRALEAMACYEHYREANDPLADLGKKIPELMCKSTPIQERVAQLYGATYVVRMASAIIGTFGILSFLKAGPRRPVQVLHKLNLVASESLMIVSCLFGGNFDLGASTLYASYSDVFPDPATRSNLIFITTSLQYASQAICLPISSRLMDLDGKGGTSIVAFWAALACAGVALFVVVFLLPETYQPESLEAKPQDDQNDSARDDRTRSHVGSGPEGVSGDTTSQPRATDSPAQPSTSVLQILVKEFGLLKITFIMGAMICSMATARMIDWYALLQYPSIKFHWTLSKTTLLITLVAAASFLNFILLIPLTTNLLTRTLTLAPRTISTAIFLISTATTLVAATLMGLPAATPAAFAAAAVLYALGSGTTSALQTFAVNAAPGPRAAGAALAVLSLGATAGKVSASFLWPVLLRVGLELDGGSGRWGGLPFFFVVGLALVGVGSLGVAEWVVRKQDMGRVAALRDGVE